MVKPIDFHPAARAEFDAAVAYYERQRPGLGRDLFGEVMSAVGEIQAHPQKFPGSAVGKARQCPVRRFPYSILYREQPNRVWIAAVAHHKRRPGYWSRRKP